MGNLNMFSSEGLRDVPFDLSVYSKCHHLANVFLLAFALNFGNISFELFVLVRLSLVRSQSLWSLVFSCNLVVHLPNYLTALCFVSLSPDPHPHPPPRPFCSVPNRNVSSDSKSKSISFLILTCWLFFLISPMCLKRMLPFIFDIH